ncbi:hypothetical protein [Spirosoma pulveris]
MNQLYSDKAIRWVMAICIALLCLGQSYAQSASFGNTFIGSTSEMSIVGVQHDFQNGGSGVQPGIVGTERSGPQGFLSFSAGASHINASDNAFVDGYAKTYNTTAFVFPIGDNNKYRPAAVSAASLIEPITAAYYGVSPTTAITSSLKGGNEPALPSGGPFSITAKETALLAVDGVEYWDIDGTLSTRITLTWDANSNVSTLTAGNLTSLTIAGWDGTKWVIIPSTMDATSILGSASTSTAGSITTTFSLAPNTYQVYTLASLFNCTANAGTISK